MHAVIRPGAPARPEGRTPGLDLDGSAPPARILAELERHGVESVALSSGLLWRLCRDPAAFMTDLSAVGAVYHRGGRPDPADVAMAEEVFGPVLVHVPEDPPPGPRHDPAARAVLAAAAGDAAAGPVTTAQVAAYVAALRDAALESIVAALQSPGVQDDPARGWTADEVVAAAPAQHAAIVRRWIGVLTGHGRIAAVDGRLRGVDTVTRAVLDDRWALVRRTWVGVLGDATFVDYLADNAVRLDALLAGREHAAALLFPRGGTAVADAVYRDTVTARYLNAAVAAVVAHLAEHRPLRVLEVGAGTGATTDAILAALGPEADVDYLFTDVSRFFLREARRRHDRRMRFGLLDIDDPAAADLPGGYDVVVAAGVLNNARDLPTTVSALAGLLDPDGLALVTEPVHESLEILVSQVFMMTPPDDVRAVDGTTFASLARWTEVLAGAGLDSCALPAEGHPLAPLGQRLLIGRPR